MHGKCTTHLKIKFFEEFKKKWDLKTKLNEFKNASDNFYSKKICGFHFQRWGRKLEARKNEMTRIQKAILWSKKRLISNYLKKWIKLKMKKAARTFQIGIFLYFTQNILRKYGGKSFVVYAFKHG